MTLRREPAAGAWSCSALTSYATHGAAARDRALNAKVARAPRKGAPNLCKALGGSAQADREPDVTEPRQTIVQWISGSGVAGPRSRKSKSHPVSAWVMCLANIAP